MLNLTRQETNVLEAIETLRMAYGEGVIKLGKFEITCRNRMAYVRDLEERSKPVLEVYSSESLAEMLDKNNITNLNYSWQ